MIDKKNKDKRKQKKGNMGLIQIVIGIIMVIIGFWQLNDVLSIQLVSLTKAFAKGALMMQGLFFVLWGFREILGGILKHGRN